jgi:hypothetical protein
MSHTTCDLSSVQQGTVLFRQHGGKPAVGSQWLWAVSFARAADARRLVYCKLAVSG